MNRQSIDIQGHPGVLNNQCLHCQGLALCCRTFPECLAIIIIKPLVDRMSTNLSSELPVVWFKKEARTPLVAPCGENSQKRKQAMVQRLNLEKVDA